MQNSACDKQSLACSDDSSNTDRTGKSALCTKFGRIAELEFKQALAELALSCPPTATQATYERGLTFDEFVAIVMTEPSKALKLKDVVSSVAALLGSVVGGGAGGLLASLKSKQGSGNPSQSTQSGPAAGVKTVKGNGQ